MHRQSYHQITRPDQRLERLERLLQTFLERYGADHPMSRRIAEQLDRARSAAYPGQRAGQ